MKYVLGLLGFTALTAFGVVGLAVNPSNVFCSLAVWALPVYVFFEPRYGKAE